MKLRLWSKLSDLRSSISRHGPFVLVTNDGEIWKEDTGINLIK